ncbi:uncharacterized protein LOC111041403 [Myzus persicae]|uniref:uncharacterized protein LOC111041403 n=1 Tax=Myzus persicae TaxID=13164 RepID=UPI000B9338DB|nr:uncharacterized protein LOC111041403 [Myzus persicae]
MILINGIIEYDHKLTSLPRFLLIQQIAPKKSYWNTILIFTLIYYITLTIVLLIIWPPMTFNITIIGLYFIRLEFIVDVTVIYASYFFLQQLEYRFQMLNDSWKYLLPGFLAVPRELTHSITEMTLDKIRLLHAELSDLLRLFSVGYGKILLGFFVFSYIHMISCFFYTIHFDFKLRDEFLFINFLRNFAPHIFNLQNFLLVVAITIAASHVHEKKQKMISHLRLIRISNLSTNLKIQVKLFMNQITIFESSEITAFGFFSINLNLVVSILILLITGLVTLIQMKKHQVSLQTKLSLKNFLLNAYNVTSI